MEPTDTRRLADELGRRERAAAGQGQKRWGEIGHQAGDFALEVVDRRGQLTDAGDQLAGDPSDRARCRGKIALEGSQDDPPVKAARGRLGARVEFVEMPAQSVLSARPLGDEVLAVVDQEAHLTVGPVEGRDRQVRFAERRSGDRERVDRIALAGLAARAASAGHELGRDPDDGLAGDEQVVR